MSEFQQSPSRVLARSKQSPSRVRAESENIRKFCCSRTAWTVLGLLGLYSDCSDCLRTAQTVLGVHSDYMGECKVLSVGIVLVAAVGASS